jgi:regulatory protein
VRRRLTGAGYPPDLVEAAIERLLAVGYLDDVAFARAWVASRDRAHPRGATALRRELRLRGVEPSIIEAVLGEREAAARAGAEAEGEDGVEPASSRSAAHSPAGSAAAADAEAARRLLERRRAALDRIADPRRRRARAYALLARAGFEPEIAADLARRVGEAADDPAGAADDPGDGFGVD